MSLVRPADPSLAPFVSRIWAIDQRGGNPPTPGAREHVLPTGASYLVFLLADAPLRIFGSPDDAQGRLFGSAVVGGARSGHYIRDTSSPACSIGAELRPGAAELLFGATSEELARRHTSLDELWGGCAGLARERLLEAQGAEAKLAAFERILAARLTRERPTHPAVEYALAAFETGAAVGPVARRTGYSHRHFVALFRRFVGLPPKAYCRVLRFQHALERASSGGASWAEIAAETGYSDQAHFSREFAAFSGVSPAAYRRISPPQPNHLPLPGNPGAQGQIPSRLPSGARPRLGEV